LSTLISSPIKIAGPAWRKSALRRREQNSNTLLLWVCVAAGQVRTTLIAPCALSGIRSEKRFFSSHLRDRPGGVASLDDAEPRRRARIEQRRSGERIGMIADVSGIGALNHPDAGVMVDRDNAHRDACEQLAHYVAVPQGINRDFFQASLFSYSGE